MEKEYFILKVVIDMKAISKMIEEMEKELCIIKMVIKKWEIIQKIKKLGSIYFGIEMEKLKQKIIKFKKV